MPSGVGTESSGATPTSGLSTPTFRCTQADSIASAAIGAVVVLTRGGVLDPVAVNYAADLQLSLARSSRLSMRKHLLDWK
jgi:hypothetical protein